MSLSYANATADDVRGFSLITSSLLGDKKTPHKVTSSILLHSPSWLPNLFVIDILGMINLSIFLPTTVSNGSRRRVGASLQGVSETKWCVPRNPWERIMCVDSRFRSIFLGMWWLVSFSFTFSQRSLKSFYSTNWYFEGSGFSN